MHDLDGPTSGDEARRLDAALRHAFGGARPAGGAIELFRSAERRRSQAVSGDVVSSNGMADDAAAADGAGGNADPWGLPGTYLVQHEIAHGGMGTVLLARDLTLGRDVAVKVLHSCPLERPSLVRRFLEEAQIGAQLQHPGIAPVHEIGITARARPFIAMKLVQGSTFAERLAADRATPQGRAALLRVFGQVCDTVAYAHARGVVHRDLKPSNVMVGAFGEVLVMDWGIAKARGGPDAENDSTDSATAEPFEPVDTMRGGEPGHASVAGSILGTYAYMAPEQARGQIERVDARADVFGLGAMLCEILTGRPAHRSKRGEDLHAAAVRGDVTEALAALSAADVPQELAHLARRCLATAPDDRPPDARAVAQCIRAHELAHAEHARAAELAAVEARTQAEAALAKASVERRARRVVGFLLVAIICGAVLSYAVVRSERNHAVQKERVASQISEVLAGLFESADPARFGGDVRSTKEVLEDAHRRLRARRDLVPEVRAGIAHALGRLCTDLGDADRAEALLNEALQGREQAPGPDSLEAAATHEALGRLLLVRDAARAMDQFRAAQSILQKRPEVADVDLRRIELEVLRAMSPVLDTTSYLAALDEYLPRVTAERADLRPLRVEAVLLRGERLALNTRIVAARPWFDEARALVDRHFGSDHPLHLRVLAAHARFRGLAGDHRGSLDELALCLDLATQRCGSEHTFVLALRYDWMEQLWKAGRPEDAAKEGEQLVPKLRARFDPQSLLTKNAILVLAKVYIDIGRARDALPLMEEMQRITAERTVSLGGGLNPANTGDALRDLARAGAAAGDLTRAEALLRQAVAVYQYKEGHQPGECQIGQALVDLAEVLQGQGRSEEAEQTGREAVQRLWWAVPVLPDVYLRAVRFLCQRYAQRGGPARATRLLDDEIARIEARRVDLAAERDQLPFGLHRYACCVRALGALHLAADHRQEARGLLDEAIALLDGTVGPGHPLTRAARADRDQIR